MNDFLSEAEWEATLKHVKEEISKYYCRNRQGNNLTNDESRAISKINCGNLVLFLLRHETRDIFNICRLRDWVCVKQVESLENSGRIAFLVQVWQEDFVKSSWEWSRLPENVPKYLPKTKKVKKIIKKIKTAKRVGWLVPSEKENKDSVLVNERGYKSRFDRGEQQLMRKNDGWYVNRKKVKSKNRKRFKFWEQPV